jgi:5-methylcytosine-specific restriction endonuclease McrA
MPNKIDLTGQIFGRLTVLEPVESKRDNGGRKRTRWLCVCECGNEVIALTDTLKNGHTKSCGCLKLERVSELHEARRGSTTFSETEAFFRGLYLTYKYSAKTRNLTFALNEEDVREIAQKPCMYCGQLDEKCITYSVYKKVRRKASGIDRLDNKRGYELDNVVPCCERCNMAKKTMDYQEFTTFIKDVYEHLIGV